MILTDLYNTNKKLWEKISFHKHFKNTFIQFRKQKKLFLRKSTLKVHDYKKCFVKDVFYLTMLSPFYNLMSVSPKVSVHLLVH